VCGVSFGGQMFLPSKVALIILDILTFLSLPAELKGKQGTAIKKRK
jgi:hypothetical protein